MTTAATHNAQSNPTEATLFVAFALSEKTWKLGFTTRCSTKSPRPNVAWVCRTQRR